MKSNQKARLKSYKDMNPELRKKRKMIQEKCKEIIENVIKQRNINLVATEAKRHNLVSEQQIFILKIY